MGNSQQVTKALNEFRDAAKRLYLTIDAEIDNALNIFEQNGNEQNVAAKLYMLFPEVNNVTMSYDKAQDIVKGNRHFEMWAALQNLPAPSRDSVREFIRSEFDKLNSKPVEQSPE